MSYTLPYKSDADCYLIEVGGSIEPCHYCGGCASERIEHLNDDQHGANQFVNIAVIPVYSQDMQGDEYCDMCLGFWN